MVNFSINTDLADPFEEMVHKCVLSMVVSHPYNNQELSCVYHFRTHGGLNIGCRHESETLKCC